MKYAVVLLLLTVGSLSMVDALPKNKAGKNYAVIKDMNEYKQVCNSRYPTVITFSSPSCPCCVNMEPHFNAAAAKYTNARFYAIENAKDKAFEELHKKIQGYPTTHFRAPGKDVRIERGQMSEKELDDISYEIAYGSPKPVSAPKTLRYKSKTNTTVQNNNSLKVSPKKSLEEPTE